MSRRDRPGARSLHCRGYDIHRIGEKDLRSAFSEYGKVVDVYLPKDYHTKQLRGFAYIQFDSEAEADSARQKLDRTDVFQDNHHVNIMWATGERKTPTDMRRLDIERDNPHARSDREPGSDRPSWPGPDDYGRRREGGRGGGRGGGGGGRDRYNDRASRGGYDDRGSRGYDDRGPPREHRDRDRDRDYDRDRDGGRDGGRARDRYRDHARDRDRDYDRDYDRDARGSRDDRDFEPDDRRRDRDRDRDDGGNGGGGGSGGGGGGGGGGSRYGFGGHSRRRSPSPRRDYDRDRDYDRGDGPDRDSRKRGRDASPRRSSRDDPDARRPYSRSRSRSRSPTRRRTDDASFDQPRPKDSGDRDDADRKWDKPAANSSFPGSSTNAEAAGFGHGSENRPGAEANGRESRDAGLENDISGKGPAEDDAQRRARSSTGLKLRSAPLSPVETTPESR